MLKKYYLRPPFPPLVQRALREYSERRYERKQYILQRKPEIKYHRRWVEKN
jgi:hypothetical protein